MIIDCRDAKHRVRANCAQCDRGIRILEINLVQMTAGDHFGITVECDGCGEIDREIIDARYLNWLIRNETFVILEFFDTNNGPGPKYLEVRLFEKEDAQQIADIASLIWGCRDGETA